MNLKRMQIRFKLSGCDPSLARSTTTIALGRRQGSSGGRSCGLASSGLRRRRAVTMSLGALPLRTRCRRVAALVMSPGPCSPSPLALRATAPRAAMGVTGTSGPGAWAYHGGDGPRCVLAPFDMARLGKPHEHPAIFPDGPTDPIPTTFRHHTANVMVPCRAMGWRHSERIKFAFASIRPLPTVPPYHAIGRIWQFSVTTESAQRP